MCKSTKSKKACAGCKDCEKCKLGCAKNKAQGTLRFAPTSEPVVVEPLTTYEVHVANKDRLKAVLAPGALGFVPAIGSVGVAPRYLLVGNDESDNRVEEKEIVQFPHRETTSRPSLLSWLRISEKSPLPHMGHFSSE